jgi:hypothetical protein
MFKFSLPQSDTEPAVYKLWLVCKFFANSCQHCITQWLCELQFKQSSHLLKQRGPANPAAHIQFPSYLCCIHTSQQIKKITILQRVTFSFGWYRKSLQYFFFHSTCQGMSIAYAFIVINYWQDTYQYKNYFIHCHVQFLFKMFPVSNLDTPLNVITT